MNENIISFDFPVEPMYVTDEAPQVYISFTDINFFMDMSQNYVGLYLGQEQFKEAEMENGQLMFDWFVESEKEVFPDICIGDDSTAPNAVLGTAFTLCAGVVITHDAISETSFDNFTDYVPVENDTASRVTDVVAYNSQVLFKDDCMADVIAETVRINNEIPTSELRLF